MPNAEMDHLVSEVAATEGVKESVSLLLARLHGQFSACADSPVKLQALLTWLSTDREKLTEAIMANAPPADPHATPHPHGAPHPKGEEGHGPHHEEEPHPKTPHGRRSHS